jgi:hypothetical protein
MLAASADSQNSHEDRDDSEDQLQDARTEERDLHE